MGKVGLWLIWGLAIVAGGEAHADVVSAKKFSKEASSGYVVKEKFMNGTRTERTVYCERDEADAGVVTHYRMADGSRREDEVSIYEGEDPSNGDRDDYEIWYAFCKGKKGLFDKNYWR